MRVSRQVITAAILLAAGSCVDQPLSPPARTLPQLKLSASVSAVSRILYFRQDDVAGSGIYVVNSDGTANTRLTGNGYYPRWSPDGRRIAFTNILADGNREIYVMNADGSNQIGVTNDPALDQEPAWSPDGDHIVFSSNRNGNFDIYEINVDGTGLTQLTNTPAEDLFPDWGPDGQIAFVSDGVDHRPAVYVMNADGSNQTQLVLTQVMAAPRWSPDGRLIAFVKVSVLTTDIYVMNADGSAVTQLTHTTLNENFPDWSADGLRICFDANDGVSNHLYIMNRDGSAAARITTAAADEFQPDWEPLPRTTTRLADIAFSTDRDGNYEIYSMTADGANLRPITIRSNFNDWSPAWSSDGQKIAFASNPLPAYPYDIYTMNADGSGLTRLTNGAGVAQNLNPAWSPDGRELAFVSTRENGAEIYVMNADGSNQTRLTFSRVPETSWPRHPAWSPDGRQLAFNSRQSGQQHINVMNRDGTDERMLTTVGPEDDWAAWSPDGTRIAFMSARDGNPNIYIMNADGSNQTRLTSEPTYEIMPTWSPDGQYIAYASNRNAVPGGPLHYDIYIITVDGLTPPVQITNQPAVMWMPAWRPNGVSPSQNHVPVANAGSDITAFRSTPTVASVALDATQSTDADGDALEFTWFDGATQIASGATPTVEFASGTHNVELRVVDGKGGESSDLVVVDVVNRPPVVSTGGPYTGFEGTALALGATASDADHDDLSYSWSLGESAAATGPAFPTSRTYSDNGNYTASFSASDRFGGSDTKSTTVAIANVAPEVRITGRSASGVSGSLFNISGGFSDPGMSDAPWTWQINWGDGTPSAGVSLNQLDAIASQHRFLQARTYQVELVVTDKDGGTGRATASISVGRLPVRLDAFPFITDRPRSVLYNQRKPELSEPVIIALLGTADFIAADPITGKAMVDLASVRLSNVPVATLPFALASSPNGSYVAGALDVNGDGRLDLVLTFQTQRLVQAGSLSPTISTPQTLTLTGDHRDGRQFSGTQQIQVVLAR
jgi:Tol biopolymer transport system component